MNNGFIKLHRSLTKWYGIGDPARVSLWVHIIMLANHAPKKWLFNGEPYSVERGQFITSRKSLSRLVGISESKVQRLLKEFESEQQIEQQTNNISRLITVVNYNKYQDNEQQMNNRRTTDEQQMNTNKNNKNNKNDKKKNKVIKESSFSTDFDALWMEYPRKEDRKSALRHFNSSVKTDLDLVNIKKALSNYIKYSKDFEMRYVKKGSTWFNNWEDWINWEDPDKLVYPMMK